MTDDQATCSQCGQTKEAQFFHKSRKSKTGLKGYCKECAKIWEKRKTPEAQRNMDLMRSYGISLSDFAEMANKQNGKCLICQSGNSPLFVDHCHSTGVIRGLLCSCCNAGLGRFKDNPQTLRIAIEYLEKERKVTQEDVTRMLLVANLL